MDFDKDFSIIIPHRDSLQYLSKLFFSIPKSDRIEIILVDNSVNPITKEDVKTDREFLLLYSQPERGAGGARNLGIENAHGKWLIFADSDDYFSEEAFALFYQYYMSDAEVIYFCMSGIYTDTGKNSDRGYAYTRLVNDYLNGTISEYKIRTSYSSPCAKMVKHVLVYNFAIRYDEVVASNDVMFSLKVGYYAQKIDVCNKVVYIATVSRGTLTKRRDYATILARFKVALRRNNFLKYHQLKQYQSSVMYYIYALMKMRIWCCLKILLLLIKYRQNPFIGFRNWIKSYILIIEKEKIDNKYITK